MMRYARPLPPTPDGTTRAAAPEPSLAVLQPEDVFRRLGSDPLGLGDAEAQRRLARYGPNRIIETRGPGIGRRLLEHFIHLFALLLWVGSALALLAGMPSLAIAIVVVVLLNGVFGLLQEYRAERGDGALKRLLPQSATVVLGGGERSVAAESLVSRRCAASSGARSPSETGRVLKEALGSTAYLAAKATGDKSMPRESGTYLKTLRIRFRKTRAKG